MDLADQCFPTVYAVGSRRERNRKKKREGRVTSAAGFTDDSSESCPSAVLGTSSY